MSTPADSAITIPQRLVRGCLAVVGGCVLYAASIGPMMVASASTGFPAMKTLASFYAPLVFLADKTSTDSLLVAYYGWWISSFRPKQGYEFSF